MVQLVLLFVSCKLLQLFSSPFILCLLTLLLLILQSVHGETERRQPQLQAVVDLAEALKAVLRGNGGLVDDKVSLLQCNWIAVTSRAEEWLNLLLVSGGRGPWGLK